MFGGIVMNVEMRGFEYAEIERVVVDFVASKRLRVCDSSCRADTQRKADDAPQHRESLERFSV